MPRIDGLPAADPLTGSEPFAMMQGGVTKNATPEQLLAFFVANISFDGSGTPIVSTPAFSGASVNGQGHLILTRSDGVTLDVGSVVGPAGPTIAGAAGPGFTTATVTSAGHLVLTRTDGTTLDLGNVSSTIKIGTTLTQASDGTLDAAGATLPNLPPVTNFLGTLLSLVSDPAGNLKRATEAQRLAWMLANDGSVDETTLTPLTLSQLQQGTTLVRAIYAGAPAIVATSTLQAFFGATGGSSGGTTPAPANATTYTISTPSSGTAGTAQAVTVAVSGTLGSVVVVTLTDGASGTFGGTVTLAAGTNPSGSTTYTPASAGTRTIAGTNNGGLTNPAGQSVTVAAAQSGTTTYPTATLTGSTIGPAKFGNGLTSGKVSGTVPGGDIIVLSATVNFGTAPASPSPYALVFGFKIAGKSYGFSMGDSVDYTYADYAGNNQSGHTFQDSLWDNQPRQVQVILNRVTPYNDHPGTSHVNFIINGQSFKQDDIPAFATGDALSWLMDKSGLGQGGYVDNIELLNSYDGLPSAVPSAPASRTPKTIYIYTLDVDGRGS